MQVRELHRGGVLTYQPLNTTLRERENMNRFFVIDIASMLAGTRTFVPTVGICTNPMCVNVHMEREAVFQVKAFALLSDAQNYVNSTQTPAPIGSLLIEVIESVQSPQP
jgi:bifunctional N-acetylglucosamine-1-phosphate-uridyltransferase/glucosamine-1-phosphate-acetyltransferase GlmU-like protein